MMYLMCILVYLVVLECISIVSLYVWIVSLCIWHLFENSRYTKIHIRYTSYTCICDVSNVYLSVSGCFGMYLKCIFICLDCIFMYLAFFLKTQDTQRYT